MTTNAKFLFLGTGGSMGIPLIGCECPICSSTSSFNRRSRPSALITFDEKNILIDCGPDFREQALKYKINRLGGICFTHSHYDHTAGVDELRIYNLRWKKELPCLLSRETAEDLAHRFYYLFDEKSPYAQIMAKFSLQFLEKDRGAANFQGLKVRYMSYQQLGMKVNGFRFGNLAYVTDIQNYPETIFSDLAGIDILILSALRFTPSPMHFSVDQAIDFAQKLQAKEVWLTHIAHELEHEKTNAYLPSNMKLAYDGLELNFQPEFI